MATIKSYTDISQSKKLAEILPIESADMYYCYGMDIHTKKCGYDIVPTIIDADNQIDICDIPCWSLAALLEQFEDTAGLSKDYGLWFCYDNRKSYCTKHYDNPVDACYEMIIKLSELEML